MECNYSLHPEHCGSEEHHCTNHTVGDGPICFCWPSLFNGVHMVHADGNRFHQGGFLGNLWDAFERVILRLFVSRKKR